MVNLGFSLVTQCSKKGAEKVLGRVLGKGSQKGPEKGAFFCGFTVKKGSEKGSQKGFREGGFQKVPRTPPRRVRPRRRAHSEHQHVLAHSLGRCFAHLPEVKNFVRFCPA